MIPYVTVFVHGRGKTDRDRTNRSILTQPIGISNDFCRQLSIGERKAVMKCILMRIYERSEIGDGISESLQIQLIYRFSCAEVDVHFVRFRFYDFRLSSPVVSPRMASRPTPANRITRLHGIFNCGHNFIWFFSVFASMQWDLNKKKLHHSMFIWRTWDWMQQCRLQTQCAPHSTWSSATHAFAWRLVPFISTHFSLCFVSFLAF